MARPWLVVLLLVALLAAAALGEAPALDPAARVSVTTAGGEQRELSAAEFEQLARARHAAQAELQREPTERRVERAELAELEKEDPELARLVAAARAAFAALQTHGYARGYALAGFSEVDGDRETRSLALAAARRGELRALLELRAARDHERSDANPGTGSFPRRSPPEQLHYHVDVLDDAQGRLSVVAAWELDAAGRRNVRLSIVKSAALLERELARRGALGGSAALALLAGGLLLVALGVLALYGSRKPAPRARAAPRKPSADLWELDEDQAPPVASGSAAAHKKTQ